MQASAKAVILATLSVVLGATLAAGATPTATPSPTASPSTSPKTTGPQPKAVVSEMIHDFGQVSQGTKLLWEFTIKNEGQAALQISEVRPSCACTVASFDKTIAPGASGRVRAEIDTLDLSGPISKQLVVLTNDPSAPSLTLTMQALLKPHVVVEPSYVRFIVVEHEAAQTQSAAVWAPDFQDFQIVKATSPYAFVKVAFHEAHGDERNPGFPGRQWRIDVTLTPEGGVGALAQPILLETNHPQQKTVSLAVTGFMRPVLALTPPVADFGKLSVSEPYRRSLKVQNFGSEPIVITKAVCSVPNVTVELQPIKEGRIYTLWVTLQPKLKKGDFTGTITLETTNPKHPKIEVELRGSNE